MTAAVAASGEIASAQNVANPYQSYFAVYNRWTNAYVDAFRTRPLEGRYPYVFLDATYCKARVNRRVVSQAVVIATGVAADGHREVLGFAVGDSEDGAFWTAFLRSLKARGLAGVQLVISDAHEGLKQAIAQVLSAPWQRCTVHFLRDCLGHARKDQHGLLAALIRPIFNADSHAQARDRLAGRLAARAPRGTARLAGLAGLPSAVW